jgi:protein-S-isoprenylcysteine O-methyltransferase Ste14
MFSAFLMVAIFPELFFRQQRIGFLDGVAEVFGIALILFGQILRVSARGYKSEMSFNGHHLAEGGPYDLVRNPMYLGIILISLGVILMLFEWWAILIFFLFFALRYIYLIVKEEKALLEAFPKDYAAYQCRVPRIIPSLGYLLKKDIREYLPLRFIWVKKEIGAIIGVLFLALFLESWEDIKRQGLALYLIEAKYMAMVILLFFALTFYLAKYTRRPL